MKNFLLMCDGGSRGNPGPSACGFVVYEIETGFESSKDSLIEIIKLLDPVISEGVFLGNTTNNVAEWSGLDLGLQSIQKKYGNQCCVRVLLDSELVMKQVLGIYKVKQEHLKPFNNSVKIVSKSFLSFAIEHVYREFNKESDNLVNICLDRQ
jgi:ribonuclease HI